MEPELTEAAAHEPRLAAPSVGSSDRAHRQGPSASSSGGRQGGSQKQVRISALERQLQQLRAGRQLGGRGGGALSPRTRLHSAG